jgi:hypothetical protein
LHFLEEKEWLYERRNTEGKGVIRVAGLSKNDPNQRKKESTVKLALSFECEACIDQCVRGKQYIERINAKGCGIGVPCRRK